MSVSNDLQSIVDVIKTMFPTSTVIKSNVPDTPPTNSFVVRILSNGTESETAFHMRNDRDYQVIYFGTDSGDILTKIDTIDKKLNSDLRIPINGSLRYIRVTGFSYGMPFKTESGVNAIISVLRTEVREARDQVAYDKIANLYVNTTIN